MIVQRVKFFELIPKTAQLTIRTLVPSKYKEIDTYMMACVFLNQGVLKKSICSNVTDSADKCIKQCLHNSDTEKKVCEFSELDLSPEAKILIDDVIYFKDRYSSTMTSDILTTYLSYQMITNPNLKCYNFLYNCIDKRYFSKIREELFGVLSEFVGVNVSEKLLTYGEYLTNPLKQKVYDCYGREEEIQSSIDCLCRMEKNNVILVGNAGVGKTTIVYGICNIIQSKDCPKNLRGYSVFSLNTTKVVSGTTYRGDLEKRFDEILTELEKNSNIILFIDEMHNLFDKPTGTDDSSSLKEMLKTYLTKNSKVIGCTTNSEYKTIESDRAFERRFSVVRVGELEADKTLDTITNKKSRYEDFHNIDISNDVCSHIISRCSEYMKNRYFPDKAFDILDTSCVICAKHNRKELSNDDIDQAIFDVTGIDPRTKNVEYISEVQSEIKNIIIGQDSAIDSLSHTLKKYYLGLKDKKKPIGSFLFVGPTGTGKTELCIQLAKRLFKPDCFRRYDMSEFMEQYSVSKLIGCPPGYVGFNATDTLAEFVKHNPFSVILFDEIEKAHKDVINILLQIMDYGSLTDANGAKVDFCNTLIVMTSNIGCKEFLESNNIGFNNEKSEQSIVKYINNFFSPEFRNRLDDIIIFNKIDSSSFNKIFEKELKSVIDNFSKAGITITIDTKAKNHLKEMCTDDKNGVRFIRRTISKCIEKTVFDNMSNNTKFAITFNKKFTIK